MITLIHGSFLLEYGEQGLARYSRWSAVTDDAVGKATKENRWGQYWEPIFHDLDLDYPLTGQPGEYRVYNRTPLRKKEEADTSHKEEVGWTRLRSTTPMPSRRSLSPCTDHPDPQLSSFNTDSPNASARCPQFERVHQSVDSRSFGHVCEHSEGGLHNEINETWRETAKFQRNYISNWGLSRSISVQTDEL